MPKINGDAWKNTDAYAIAKKLDLKDGDDGKITKNIWDQFINSFDDDTKTKMRANTISNFIRLEEATASITKYFARVLGTDFNNREKQKELTKEMNKNIAKIDSKTPATTPTSQEPAPAASEEPTPAVSAQPKEEQPQFSANDYKVTVPEHTVTKPKPTDQDKALADRATANQKSGKALATEILTLNDTYCKVSNDTNLRNLKASLKNITPENVAYVVSNIHDIAELIDGVDFLGQGLDKSDVFNLVVEKLQKRAYALGLNVGADITSSASLEKMKERIKTLSDAIRAKENGDITNYNKKLKEYEADVRAVNKYNKEQRPKSQATFDEANQLLVEVANMKKEDRPQIVTDPDNNPPKWKILRLPDKRWIYVDFDSNGEIKNIGISHDTSEDIIKDGKKGDSVDVSYIQDEAGVRTEHPSSTFQDTITSGYDFEKIKALAKQIFDME